jgi:Nucleotidyl transferase AbiEii toxin, Type IV TA system
MVALGIANSRMKDFFDVWFLAENFPFDGGVLQEAIAKTFERRQTAISAHVPLALTDEFAQVPAKQAQWRGFVKKGQLGSPHIELQDIIMRLREFLMPVLIAAQDKAPFGKSWKPSEEWI